MPEPLWSIVIPTYNRAGLLPRAVDSALRQTYPHFEILIVDDASSDETASYATSISDPRVSYFRCEENRGNAATRNVGVSRARGEWISFLDDDDELLPEFLEATRERLGRAGAARICWCGVRKVRDHGTGEVFVGEGVWTPEFGSKEAAYLAFLRNRHVGTDCGLTVHREVFDVVGAFDERLRKAVDTDFLIRAVREFDFAVVPRILVKVHDHDGPRVRSGSRRGAEAYVLILEKHLATLERHPRTRAEIERKIGWLFYHSGAASLGGSWMRKSLRHRPTAPGTWLLWLLLGTTRGTGPAVHRALSSVKKAMVRPGSAGHDDC